LTSLFFILVLLVLIALLLVPLVLVGVVVIRRIRRRQPRLRPAVVLWIVTSVVLVAPIAFSMFRHDVRLARLQRAVFSAPAPSGAEVVMCSGEVGLMSNGNHCDYVVRVVLRTQLPDRQVRAHYRHFATPLPLPPGYFYQAPPLVFRDSSAKGSMVLVELEWPGDTGSQGYDLRCT
jgi:hypothetical protein